MSKENVYDEQIHPLMDQILEICKQHNIPMIASFGLDKDEGLMCTSALLADEYEPEDCQLEALRVLRQKPMFAAFAITSADGGQV